MYLWELAGYEVENELNSLLSWADDDAVRKPLFDEFFVNDPTKHTWYDVESVIYQFDGQEARENVIFSLIDPKEPVPYRARGLYYDLYINSHNKRWLELAEPKILFKNSLELSGHELFFLSEISILLGQIEKGLQQRAEYILSQGYKQFISTYDFEGPHLLYDYVAVSWCGNDKNNHVYYHSVLNNMYLPCSATRNYRYCEPITPITYHFVACENDENKDKNKWVTIDRNRSTENVIIDFERMARMCFPKESNAPPTPEQRDCVFNEIKEMDIKAN
jgi:hypothetical protein